MLTALAVMVLAYGPPSYEEKYLTGCYDQEEADRCADRQRRWKADIKRYEDELASVEDSQFQAFAKEQEQTIAPAPGAAKIAPQRPSWCAGFTVDQNWTWSSVGRSLRSHTEGRFLNLGGLASAAQVLCRKPEDPVVQKVTASVLQAYVNTTGVSADEAPRNMTWRLDEKLVAAKKALCGALPYDEEMLGAEKTFAETRLTFFGCSPSTNDKTDDAQWTGGHGQFGFKKVLWYLDTDAQPASELVRLAYLLDTVSAPADDYSYKASIAATYAWLQYDMKNLDVAKLQKEFAEAPYKDNAWAQLILSESLGRYRTSAAEFEAFVKKTAKDEDWKNIISGAPEKAVKEWTAQAEKNKAAMQDARDFEGKLFAPSLKAGKGCSAKLRPAFNAWLKGLKARPSEFDNAVAGDMVGSFLLQHLAACEAVEGNEGFARLLEQVRGKARLVRGPRLASYYAAVEAVGQAKADRPKFPLEPNQLWSPAATDIEDRAGEAMKGNSYLNDTNGSVVKAVQKGPKVTKVTFITESYQFMGQSCVATNRIFRINSSGVVEYYSSCKDTGMQTATKRVGDITVPNEFAAGIAPGRYVDFAGPIDPREPHFPVAVYADKSKSKLVNWRGFGL